MMKSIAFCQIGSNDKFPKTISGIVDLGNEKYALFTMQQKARILDCIIRLDECEKNRLEDSVIIALFEEKTKTDSAAISLCEKRYAKLDEMYNLSQESVSLKEKEIKQVKSDLASAERKAKREKLFKKIGAVLGSTLGLAGGILVGYFANELKNGK